MATISILVAAYNAEQYIRKCLDSLSAQTLRDFEAIIIDDGSTDSTADIAAAYAARDPRFKLLKLGHNVGQARARNEGLTLCGGRYIGFLDSDDWFAPSSLQTIVEAFERNAQADCVLFRCVRVEADGTQRDYQGRQFSTMTGREAFRESLTWNVHGWYVARRELYEKYPYDATCRSYSDDNTTRLHYYYSREVVQTTAPYYYLLRTDSVTSTASPDRMMWLIASDSMRRQLHELHCEEEILNLYEEMHWKIAVDCYMTYYHNRRQWTDDERRQAIKTIQWGWKTTDFARISGRLKYKFGYAPCRPLWWLFVLEEELYFLLKTLVKGSRR